MPSDELTNELAEDFLRCRFPLSDLDLWLAAPDGVRRVLVAAAHRVEAERASRSGYASLSEYHAAEVQSPADGGRLLRRLALRDSALSAAGGPL